MNDGDKDRVLGNEPTVGLAISGGGYRAAAWGLGAVLALADMRDQSNAPSGGSGTRRPRVSSVASVSGGSITNGEFGLDIDLASSTAADVDARAVNYAPLLVGRRWAFYTVLASVVLIHVLVPLFGPAVWSDALVRWLIASLGALAVGVLSGHFSGDLLFGWWPAWAFVGVAGALMSAIPYLFANDTHWVLRTLVIVALVLLLWVRPYLVGAAMNSHFRSAPKRNATPGDRRRSPKLTDLGAAGPVAGSPSPLHVICTTDLAGHNHVYLANRFLFNHDHGGSTTPSMRVSAAVQASSNLPVAFNVRGLRFNATGPDGKPHRSLLAVSDGGVYDNMGSQWFTGLARRRQWLNDLGATTQVFADIAARLDDPDIVVVANASGLGELKSKFGAFVPVLGHGPGLGAVVSVLYEQTTAHRRWELVADFDHDSPPGTLVHIRTGPDSFVRYRAAAAGTDQARAVHAKAAFEALAHEWAGEARSNTAVATAFWPLSRSKMASVIHHAYLQTMLNMHVKFDTPLRVPPRHEFAALIDGHPRDLQLHWH